MIKILFILFLLFLIIMAVWSYVITNSIIKLEDLVDDKVKEERKRT